MLAFPLHLALMTDRQLPVPGDRARPHRQPDHPAPPDPRDRASRCRCACGPRRSSRTRAGRQFSLRTEVARRRRARVGGGLDEPARGGGRGGGAARPRSVRAKPTASSLPAPTATWRLPGDLGRRYGVGVRRPEPDPHAPAERAAVRLPGRDRARDVDQGAVPGRARVRACPTLHRRGRVQASRSCCRRRSSSARPSCSRMTRAPPSGEAGRRAGGEREGSGSASAAPQGDAAPRRQRQLPLG